MELDGYLEGGTPFYSAYKFKPLVEPEQILNRFDPAQIAFADVEANLRAELTERKTAPAFDSWVEELRQNRYIQILDDELKRN